MVDADLPKRPWNPNAGERSMVIDKNGIARTVMTNPYAAQEDAQRYQRVKQGEQLQQSGYSNTAGGSAAIGGAPSAAMPQEAGAAMPSGQAPDWLMGLQQKYTADIPMRMGLDPNSPVVTPEMLNPSDEELARLDQNQREGIGRVFLALVSRYNGDNTLQNALLYGTRIKGYIPTEMLEHFRKLTGRR